MSDALAALDAGADAIGLNLVASSKRVVTRELAASIRDAVGGRVEVVAIVADAPVAELADIRAQTGIDWLQLHGHEPPSDLERVLPKAYKAIAVADANDVATAALYGGERVLTDTKVSGALGGSGRVFDWTLVRELAGQRKLVLAGGLHPGNVNAAVQAVRPFGVDVASGVEGDHPRSKDVAKMVRFVREAREA